MDINQFSDPAFYLSLVAAALLTSLVVQAIKKSLATWKGDGWKWRDPVLYVSAYAAALIILFGGRRINAIGLTVSEGWLIGLQALIVGALAIGGFKTLKEAWQFVGGLRSSVTVGGDNITIDTIADSDGLVIGDDSNAEVDK